MKTRYEYIEFEEMDSQEAGKPVWRCINRKSGAQLLRVVYYFAWRCHVCTDTNFHAVFSSNCLREIADFLDQLKKGDKT